MEKLTLFSVENLVQAIGCVIKTPIDELQMEIQNYLIPRLDFLASSHRDMYFLFEERYIETEWKDMVAIHYINTSYMVYNTVMRIHLFKKEEISEKEYLGCFTLRSLDEPRFMLSYIYPNWRVISEKSGRLYMMTYRKTVHVQGLEISFDTYPLFAQDNVCVSCAQASIVSMAHYLHAKYDYERIRVSDINSAYNSEKAKVYPTRGLRPVQMLEIFNHYHIPVDFQVLVDDSDADRLKEYIDYCVESAIPVLLGLWVGGEEGISRHVIQIIGHVNADDGQKKYVFYDDSGFFLEKLRGKRGFVGSAAWEELKTGIAKRSFLIYPVHEKVYILYDVLKKHLQNMCHQIKLSEALKAVDSEIKGERILIADNCDVKAFLRKVGPEVGKINDEMKQMLDDILNKDLPHYLWYCEYQTDMGYVVFIANPTFNSQTTKNIFINKMPILCDVQLGLLTEGAKPRRSRK